MCVEPTVNNISPYLEMTQGSSVHQHRAQQRKPGAHLAISVPWALAPLHHAVRAGSTRSRTATAAMPVSCVHLDTSGVFLAALWKPAVGPVKQVGSAQSPLRE